jgi:hypothetical protein
MPTFPPRLLILSLSLSALSSIHAHASTVDAHLTQQQQYNPPPRNAVLDSNPAQIPLPLPPPPADDADADAEGPQTQPKVRRCGWEIMEDGEIPPSLLFSSPFSLYVQSIPFQSIPTNPTAGESSMARLGALYAAQTGDTSQCVDVDVVGSSGMSKRGRNRNESRDGRTSGEGNTTTTTATMTMSVGLEKTTFCACVFETCGNGVWVRDADDDGDGDGDEGSGEVMSTENEEMAWEYVKACQKYCHAGTCV